MGNTTFFSSFHKKLKKKYNILAFTDKVKIIKTYIPEKVKIL